MFDHKTGKERLFRQKLLQNKKRKREKTAHFAQNSFFVQVTQNLKGKPSLELFKFQSVSCHDHGFFEEGFNFDKKKSNHETFLPVTKYKDFNMDY